MNKTNKLDLSLNLVEDLVARNGPYNTCMVLEIRDLMEDYIVMVLLRGQTISLRTAFQHCWMELTDQDTVEMEEDYQVVE